MFSSTVLAAVAARGLSKEQMVGSLPGESLVDICFSLVGCLMQLTGVILNNNKLEGTLPETWSNLTNVSLTIQLTVSCKLCSMAPPKLRAFSNIDCRRGQYTRCTTPTLPGIRELY